MIGNINGLMPGKSRKMRMLIDSVLRGYQIPLIYLRKNQKGDPEYPQIVLEIIDGQQRINALRGFVDGVIIEERPEGRNARPFKPLYNPQAESDKHRFPASVKSTACSWADKLFDTLDGNDKKRFLDCKVPVAIMECSDDEARDLFIRLQGGSSLDPQEVRDSWPGNFCQIVLKLGGKPKLMKPGHPFFRKLMSATSGLVKTRQFVAQLLMLYLQQRSNDEMTFSTIRSGALDDYYRLQVGLSLDSPEVKRFEEILNELVRLLDDGMRPAMKNHDALHLVLFTSMLWDEYAPTLGWKNKIAGAVDMFRKEVATAGLVKVSQLTGNESSDFKDFWRYRKMTSDKADAAETIRDRHVIYERQMLKFIGPAVRPRDTQQTYTATQREAVYYRDKKQCRAEHCRAHDRTVSWSDAVVHHIEPYSQGGRTSLENGALMHQ